MEKSGEFLNVIQCVNSHKDHLKYLSLSCNAMPLPFSKILPQVFAWECLCLQSLSLTNYRCTFTQVEKILKLLALSELNLLCNYSGSLLFVEVASSNCGLKVLSIPASDFSFSMWARHGFAPPNLIVLLAKIHTPTEFNTSSSIGMHNIVNYASPVTQKAGLSFYQPTGDFFPLSYVPFIQFCFIPQNMKEKIFTFPSSKHLYPLALMGDTMGSNTFSSAVTLNINLDHLNFDAPSKVITSLKMFGRCCVTDVDLKTVAECCPNLVRLDLQHSEGFLRNLHHHAPNFRVST